MCTISYEKSIPPIFTPLRVACPSSLAVFTVFSLLLVISVIMMCLEQFSLCFLRLGCVVLPRGRGLNSFHENEEVSAEVLFK